MKKRTIQGKLVVITGATGNLGRAFCLAFGRAGAKVAACDLHNEPLEQLAADLSAEGIDCVTAVGDICQKNDCLRMVAEINAAFGGQKVYILLNNAGITHIQPYMDTDKTANIVERVMSVNFFGAVNCTEAVIEQIVDSKGLIISISSVAGFSPLVGRTAYAASKHALHGFFGSLRAELHDTGASCLLVCPSFIHAADKEQAKSAIYQDKKTVGKSLAPQTVASEVLKAAQNNKRILVLGRTGILAYFMQRFFPSWYENIMRRRLTEDPNK
jgi:short-subunit dehydrogenase